jgi:hypothetical protein
MDKANLAEQHRQGEIGNISGRRKRLDYSPARITRQGRLCSRSLAIHSRPRFRSTEFSCFQDFPVLNNCPIGVFTQGKKPNF